MTFESAALAALVAALGALSTMTGYVFKHRLDQPVIHAGIVKTEAEAEQAGANTAKLLAETQAAYATALRSLVGQVNDLLVELAALTATVATLQRERDASLLREDDIAKRLAVAIQRVEQLQAMCELCEKRSGVLESKLKTVEEQFAVAVANLLATQR